jgi:hypothetical protein
MKSKTNTRTRSIALVSLIGAAILLLALISGVLHDNQLLEDWLPQAFTHLQGDSADRVSLNLHSWNASNNPSARFSVAHPLPPNVTSSQLFSIGLDSRVAFDVFGETAHSELIADERALPQLQSRSDRLMLMLMLLRLHDHRD